MTRPPCVSITYPLHLLAHRRLLFAGTRHESLSPPVKWPPTRPRQRTLRRIHGGR